MCKWGTLTVVRVKIASHLSHSGNPEWKDVGIDACIAPLVAALQSAGVDMLASCCGHGRENGRIDLCDGSVIVVPSVSAREIVSEQEHDQRS